MTAATVRHPGELRWETRLLGIVTATLTVFGIASTYGASSMVRAKTGVVGGAFALRQFEGALIGGIFMLVLSRMDYRRLRPLAWPVLLGTFFLLLIPILPFTHAIAPSINGARRWVQFGPVNFQPSELARLAIVLWCAMLAAKKGEQIRQFKKGMLPFLCILGITSLMILLQPNMSMAVLVSLLGGIVLYAAGAKIGHFLLLGLAAVMAGLSLKVLCRSRKRPTKSPILRSETAIFRISSASDAGLMSPCKINRQLLIVWIGLLISWATDPTMRARAEFFSA